MTDELIPKGKWARDGFPHDRPFPQYSFLAQAAAEARAESRKRWASADNKRIDEFVARVRRIRDA